MYLDPNVTPEKFKTFFENNFVVDGIEMTKKTETWKLCEKSNNLGLILSKENFQEINRNKNSLR